MLPQRRRRHSDRVLSFRKARDRSHRFEAACYRVIDFRDCSKRSDLGMSQQGRVVHERHGVSSYTLDQIDDLFAVFYVHAMTAFDFLSKAEREDIHG